MTLPFAQVSFAETYERELVQPLFRPFAEAVGPIVDRRHSFGDPRAMVTLLRDAGFGDVRTTRVVRTVRFADGGTFVRRNAMALVGMSADGRDIDNAARERVIEEIVRASEDARLRYSTGETLAYDLATTLATATA